MENYTNITQSTKTRNLKPIVFFVGFLMLIAGCLLWAYSHAFIELSVENSKDDNITAKLINQKTGKATIIEKAPKKFKKLVTKGEYEVLVTQNETSYYKLTATGAFLSTTNLKATLQAEKSRAFVGDSPGPCMYYEQSLLYSSSCDADLGEINVHLPADNKSPTTTQVFQNIPGSLPVHGVVRLNGLGMLLIGNIPNDQEATPTTGLTKLEPNLQIANYQTIKGLNYDSFYSTQQFKDGFVAYDESLQNTFYYSSPDKEPEPINFAPVENKNLLPSSLTAKDQRIARVFSEKIEGEDVEDKKNVEELTKKGITYIQLIDNAQARSYEFDGIYSTVRLCGIKSLCLIKNKQLLVYDITDKKPKELFRANRVQSIENDHDNLIAFTDIGALSIDISKKQGSIQYSFGRYQFCGSRDVDNGGYVLCLINQNQKSIAIYIDPDLENIDSIDKKVLAMLDQPYIDTVSAYKSFIYIVPNLGEPVYDTALKGYATDPTIRQKTSSDINALIDRLGVDRARYNIINTQP